MEKDRDTERWRERKNEGDLKREKQLGRKDWKREKDRKRKWEILRDREHKEAERKKSLRRWISLFWPA